MLNINLVENGVSRSLKGVKGETIRELLDNNKVNSETCIISVNGILAHPTYIIKDEDKVEVIKIIYGG